MSDTVVERTPHKAQVSEGLHDAVITKVEAQDAVQTQFGLKNVLNITYDVEGIEVRRRYNKSWNKGSNLYKLVSDLRPGEVLSMRYDVAVLVGTKVQVLIGHAKTDDGSEWDNILQVSLPPAPEPMSMKAQTTNVGVETKSQAAQSLEELGDDPELTRNI
jgi:hypothetical protein